MDEALTVSEQRALYNRVVEMSDTVKNQMTRTSYGIPVDKNWADVWANTRLAVDGLVTALADVKATLSLPTGGGVLTGLQAAQLATIAQAVNDIQAQLKKDLAP